MKQKNTLKEQQICQEVVKQGCDVGFIVVPNVQGCNENANWEDYKCSVDYIEEITGFDFFELLPDDIEELLEKQLKE